MRTMGINSKLYELNQNEQGNHMVLSFNKEAKMHNYLQKCIDKECTKAVSSSNPIKVIETNMPSSQALKNLSLKLIQIKARLDSEVK